MTMNCEGRIGPQDNELEEIKRQRDRMRQQRDELLAAVEVVEARIRISMEMKTLINWAATGDDLPRLRRAIAKARGQV